MNHPNLTEEPYCANVLIVDNIVMFQNTIAIIIRPEDMLIAIVNDAKSRFDYRLFLMDRMLLEILEIIYPAQS